MKYCKITKSNEPHKILRMLSREEEMERNDGKWVAMNKVFKDKKKYDRTLWVTINYEKLDIDIINDF